jgi:acetyl esterase/lipase
MAPLSLLSRVITYQPFKAVYVLFAVALNAVKLPWWLIYFLPRALRQHPKYSYRQAVRTEILRNWLSTSSAIRIVTPLRVEPGPGVKDPKRFVRFDPSTEKTAAPEGGRYTGIVSMSSQIRPVPMFGIWYPAAPSAEQLESLRFNETAPPLILHFHGGAFAVGDPRPDYLGYLGNLFSQKLGPTLCASYRLASNPDGAFPAALQDAISAYAYVLSNLSIPARRVVISGDSAGANLALALLRYIARYPDVGLAAPGGALLWSPWLNVSAGLNQASIPSHRHANTDYLTANFAYWGASSIRSQLPTGDTSNEAAVDGPWLSPWAYPFYTPTPLWIQAGGLEVLLDDILSFVHAMEKVDGNKVQLFVEPIANHDIVLIAPVSGFEDEANHVADEAHEWLVDTLTLKA